DGWDWGAWTQMTLNISSNTAPVATIHDHSVVVNRWGQVSNWLSHSDAEGDREVRYEFYDSSAGANSASYWTRDDPHQAANQDFFVNAADINNVWIRGGAVAGS